MTPGKNQRLRRWPEGQLYLNTSRLYFLAAVRKRLPHSALCHPKLFPNLREVTTIGLLQKSLQLAVPRIVVGANILCCLELR